MFLNLLRKRRKIKWMKVDRELTKSAITIVADARSRVPLGKGSLARSIDANVGQYLNKTVSVADPNAAYVEFGTGAKVFKGPIHLRLANESLHGYSTCPAKERRRALPIYSRLFMRKYQNSCDE